MDNATIDALAQKAHEAVFEFVSNMNMNIPEVWLKPWGELGDAEKEYLKGTAARVVDDLGEGVDDETKWGDVTPSTVFVISMFCGTVRTQYEIKVRKPTNK